MSERMTQEAAEEAAKAFSRSVWRAMGVQTMSWPDGSIGVLNVPAKWIEMHGVMAEALVCALMGEPLPEVSAAEPKKRRQR